MAMLTVRVLNMGSLQGKMKRMPVEIGRAAIRGLTTIRQPLEDATKRKVLSGAKTGRIYRRYNPFRIHQASAPGQAPASDTGKLAASIEAEVDPIQFTLTLAAGQHARELEYGTHKMAARPFLRRTMLEFRERIIAALHAAIKRAL